MGEGRWRMWRVRDKELGGRGERKRFITMVNEKIAR
jgi:hypothetical protein